jgi:dethiobiotin synthetase
MTRGIFITGTDTGVGKTHVTALLLVELRRRGVRAAAFKPIACGRGGRNDARIYRALMENEISLDTINPVRLRLPLAPSVAAKLEGRGMDLRKVFISYKRLVAKYEVVLVEGAGGLMVPILENYFVADLAKALKLPLLVVARLGLGTINHSLLTVQQARGRGLKVAGIVLNDMVGRKRGLAERTNIEVVPALCRVPLLGVVPHGKSGAAVAARRLGDQLFGKPAYARGKKRLKNSTGS